MALKCYPDDRVAGPGAEQGRDVQAEGAGVPGAAGVWGHGDCDGREVSGRSHFLLSRGGSCLSL